MEQITWQEEDRQWICVVDVGQSSCEVWIVCCRDISGRKRWMAFLGLSRELWTEAGSRPAFEKWFLLQFGREPDPNPPPVDYPLLRAAGYTAKPELWRTQEVPRAKETTSDSVVYFLEAAGLDRVKIGWSIKHSNRQKDIQSCCPVTLQVVHTEPGGRPREQALHLQFAADRLHGEWFTFSDAIRNYVASNKTAEAA